MSNEFGSTLSWGQRFALVEAYGLDDTAICNTFGVTNDELVTAKEMLSENTFKVDTSFDTEQYADRFNTIAKPSAAKSAPAPIAKPQAPRTATKTVAPKKPRGRQGSNIVNAFTAIPGEPVPVETFAQDNSVSVAVLRQAKRFDKSGVVGRVRVKKDKETKQLMIWRENAE